MRTWKWMIGALPADYGERSGTTDGNTSFARQCRQCDSGGTASQCRAHEQRDRSQYRASACLTAAPTTMDQVVDRAIEREHSLIVC